jgi:hypothetical protein
MAQEVAVRSVTASDFGAVSTLKYVMRVGRVGGAHAGTYRKLLLFLVHAYEFMVCRPQEKGLVPRYKNG